MAFEVRRAENEWRYDPVDRAWTVVTRNRRLVSPLDVERAKDERALHQTLECPLCGPMTQVLDREGAVVAIPAPSALTFVEDELPPTTPFQISGALGAHEILCVLGSAVHGRDPSDIDEPTFADLLVLFSRRHADLGRDLRLASVSLAMLPVPYARTDHLVASLLATPFPGDDPRPVSACAPCDDHKTAHAQGRVILDDGGIVAYVPFAPRTSLHIRVVAPHGAVVERVPPPEVVVRRYARVIHRALTALQELQKGARLALYLERFPLRPQADGPPHLLASIECINDVDTALGAKLGARIVSAPPEEVARALRTMLG
jgi:hypothetical protein